LYDTLKKMPAKKGTKSKTRKGDLDFTTKKGDTYFHEDHHLVKKSYKPFNAHKGSVSKTHLGLDYVKMPIAGGGMLKISICHGDSDSDMDKDRNLNCDNGTGQREGEKEVDKGGGGTGADSDQVEEEEEDEGITIEKKMEFVDKVKRLTNEGLTKMVEHIQGLLPQSISDLENNRLQIKVDDFDKDTF